jgi:hypothetical protein
METGDVAFKNKSQARFADWVVVTERGIVLLGFQFEMN